jgi:hypothetical protein
VDRPGLAVAAVRLDRVVADYLGPEAAAEPLDWQAAGRLDPAVVAAEFARRQTAPRRR